MLIDSHAHLTHELFEKDCAEMLNRASDAGVEAIINICTNPQEVQKGLELQKHFPFVRLAASTTPHDAAAEGELYFGQMASYAKSGVLVGVGETGLDYYYYKDTQEIQKKWLRAYLNLAKECHLPIIIHCRDAFEDLFAILDEEYRGQPGVLHCFTGNLEEAKKVLDRGFYLSLSGIVTFKKSVDLQEIAKFVPLDRLLIETDAPYLAPQPVRSKRNEPAFLFDTARFIAHMRNISLEELGSAISCNARSLFKTL